MRSSPLRVADASLLTERSLAVWRSARPMFGVFVEAFCSQEIFTTTTKYDVELHTPGPDIAYFRGLILTDDGRRELWLSGCQSGYGGYGPEASEQILVAEGFTAAHIDVVRRFHNFRIAKDNDQPLSAGGPDQA